MPRGSAHYAWKGDAALTTTKRERAQKMYELGPCELCGKQAVDRHHRDGDTGNNVRGNIQILCRRCHMVVDGRIEKLRATVRAMSAVEKPPKPCSRCAKLAKPLRKGRCRNCAEYHRRHGVERPEEFL